jgi:steroid delta-isomerase-like uncharacterized protein
MIPDVTKDPFLKKVIAAYNGHKLEAFDTLFTDDCALVRNGVEAVGKEEVKKVLAKLYRAFPDIEYTIDDVIVAGNKMGLRWHGTGTHRGDYFGIPPTGRPLQYDGITLYELRGDKIARIWVSANMLGVVRDLGAGAEPRA